MKYVAIVFGAICLLIVVTCFAGCASYNGVVSSSQTVDQKWGDVQTAYQRRSDLIPNLVQTVQGAANFEKSTLTDVIKARASATSVNISTTTAPTDPNQLQKYEQAQGQLTQSLGRLLVSVERYPDLKASQNFLALQAQLEGTENRISFARQQFNEATQNYNTRVQSFPTMLVARLGGFTPKPYFTATTEAQTAPQVNFNFNNSTPPAPTPSPAGPETTK